MVRIWSATIYFIAAFPEFCEAFVVNQGGREKKMEERKMKAEGRPEHSPGIRHCLVLSSCRPSSCQLNFLMRPDCVHRTHRMLRRRQARAGNNRWTSARIAGLSS